MPNTKLLEIPEKEGYIFYKKKKKKFFVIFLGFLLLKKNKNNVDQFLEMISYDTEKMFLEGTSYIFSDRLIQRSKHSTKPFTEFPESQSQQKPEEIKNTPRMEELMNSPPKMEEEESKNQPKMEEAETLEKNLQLTEDQN